MLCHVFTYRKTVTAESGNDWYIIFHREYNPFYKYMLVFKQLLKSSEWESVLVYLKKSLYCRGNLTIFFSI